MRQQSVRGLADVSVGEVPALPAQVTVPVAVSFQELNAVPAPLVASHVPSAGDVPRGCLHALSEK